MVTMKVMDLRSQETVTGMKSFIVIGSSTAHGEELVSKGRVIIIIILFIEIFHYYQLQIIIYDIIEVVPEPGKPLTQHKLKVTRGH